MVYCSHCGAPIPAGAKFCTSCGQALAEAGAQAAEDATILVDAASPTPPRQILVPPYTPPPPATGPDPAPPKGSRYAPISTLNYVVTALLLCIPLLNLVLLVVWAFGGCHNVNRRNLARAALILAVLAIAAQLLLVPPLTEFISSLFSDYPSLNPPLP